MSVEPDVAAPDLEDATENAASASSPVVSGVPLVLLTAVMAVDQADRYLLSAVFPLVKEEFGLSDTQLGSLSAAFLLVVSLGAVPLGVLVDRRVRTHIAAWGCALWSLAMIATGLASSYVTLFLARMGLGIAEASYTPASFSLLGDSYPPEQRGRALGIYQVGSILGFLGLPIGGLIAATWGWRVAFHVYAISGFLLAVLLWHMREPARGAVDRGLSAVSAPGPRQAPSRYALMSGFAPFRYLLSIPTVTVSLLTHALAVFFTSGLGIWATTYLVRFHDLSIPQATAATSLLAVGAIVGALLGGYLGDAAVQRGQVAGRIYVAAAAPVLGVVLLVPAFATDSTPLMLVLFALGAVTLTMPNAPLAALRADVVHPDLRGRAASLVALLSAGAAASSPLLFGVLSDDYGLRAAFLATLPFMGLGGVLLFLLGPRHVATDRARMRRQLVEEESA